MRVAVALAMLAGCGRWDFEPLAGDGSAATRDGDGSVGCGAWPPPTELTTVNTLGDDWDPAISPDGNVLVFSQKVTLSQQDLFVALRQGNQFGAPSPIAAL